VDKPLKYLYTETGEVFLCWDPELSEINDDGEECMVVNRPYRDSSFMRPRSKMVLVTEE
jgi:hypothetical protein